MAVLETRGGAADGWQPAQPASEGAALLLVHVMVLVLVLVLVVLVVDRLQGHRHHSVDASTGRVAQ